MAVNKRVDQFDPAPPLSNGDIFPVVPFGTTTAKRTTLQDIKTFIGDISTKTFVNAAARAASVPDFTGQLGVQIDTAKVYTATGLVAGNWAPDKTTAVFANAGARAALVPNFISQVGVQTDTNAIYVSTGLAAGNWILAGGGGLSGLTAGQIDFSTSATTISDDSNLLWDNGTKIMQIGAGTSQFPGTPRLNLITTGQNSLSLVGTNTTNTSIQGFGLYEDLASGLFCTIVRSNSALPSTFNGTSVPRANSFRFTNGNQTAVVNSIVLQGNPVYAFGGATSTNFGFKQDQSGFRIDQMANLHTANTFGFELNGTFRYGSGTPGVGKILMDSGAGTGTVVWATNPAINGAGTAPFYAKFTGVSTLASALLSDDGTHIIVPNGKVITGANTALTTLAFGTSGSELLVTTDGPNFTTAGMEITQATFAAYGGINSIVEFTTLTLNANNGALTYDKVGPGAFGYVAGDAGSGVTLNGGIHVLNNFSANTTSGANAKAAGVFINAQAGTINTGVLNSVVFGNGRTATVNNTAYFSNIDMAGNVVLDTVTGTKFGTATNQKLSFWNATPIIQPTTAIAAATFVANTSGIANDSATFDGYTIGQVVKALRNMGKLA